jgi:tRNA dimethylallyltransferase
LAERIPAELVSADSTQVYRGVPVLTNQSGCPTRLVAIWELDREASVGEYQELAHAVIDEILAAGRTPIVVGGTGLYLRAALADLELPPPPEPGVRARFERLYERLGPERAHAVLAERDPAAASQIHPNDRRRVIRALELAGTGRSLRPERDRLWADEWRHPTLVFGLEVPREEIVRRIDARTRSQFAAGIEKEVKRAAAGPISTTAAKIMGLAEITSLPAREAMEAFALRNRRYASYQRKWMQRIPGLIRVDAHRPADEVADEILEVARARQRLPADRAVRSER